MPTAREALLDAALAALGTRPWSAVRMVEVAAAAGVSRQTLYNEFGSKEGLARALVRRETDACLYGVERVLAARPDAVDRLVSVAEWLAGEAAARPLLRALLTGCWGEWLPPPRPARTRAGAGSRAPAGPPAQRRADAGAPGPGELVAAVRDRSLAVLVEGGAQEGREEQVARRCEVAVRLALSYVIAPGPQELGALVRTAITGPELSAASPTAEGR